MPDFALNRIRILKTGLAGGGPVFGYVHSGKRPVF